VSVPRSFHSYLFLFAGVWVVLQMSPVTARSDTVFSNLKFSSEEVELLRTIKQVEDTAGVSASLLKAKPFIDLLTSSHPLELAVTVVANDWDQIGSALKALGTIKSCKISAEIAAFKVEYGNNRAKHPNRAFFDSLQKRYGTAC
jgi:hypothetical protein